MLKHIEIMYNGEKKIKCASKEIDFSAMTITAGNLLDLLDYSIGDTYQIEKINFDNLDKKITDSIQPVYTLIKNLIDDINKLADDTTLKQKERVFVEKTTLE